MGPPPSCANELGGIFHNYLHICQYWQKLWKHHYHPKLQEEPSFTLSSYVMNATEMVVKQDDASLTHLQHDML